MEKSKLINLLSKCEKHFNYLLNDFQIDPIFGIHNNPQFKDIENTFNELKDFLKNLKQETPNE